MLGPEHFVLGIFGYMTKHCPGTVCRICELKMQGAAGFNFSQRKATHDQPPKAVEIQVERIVSHCQPGKIEVATGCES